MKIVIYSLILNQHQAPVADQLWEMTHGEFCFVELASLAGEHQKGGAEDYSSRPYLLRAWESGEKYAQAMELARTAEVCVFSGVLALPFQKERMRLGLLSLDMSERWLKQGWKNLLSPTILKMLMAYKCGGWNRKPLYKLCCSAFAAEDHRKLGMYDGKCFKWGYFTENKNEKLENKIPDNTAPLRLMWVARYIPWKHPEMIIRLAYSLRDRGHRFHIDMYGDGVLFERIERLRNAQALHDVVSMHGNVANDVVRQAMREHDVLLVTSDSQEGWGAVVNEAMSEGCIVVGSDAIGSVPYLVEDGVNGLQFKSEDDASLLKNVVWLIEHPEERAAMAQRAQETMKLWSPENAARSLLQLIEDLQNGREGSVMVGPCSKG